MKKCCQNWLGPALTSVCLMFGAFNLQAGSGSIQGVARSGCVDPGGMSSKPYMLAEALNAKNGMVVATAEVNYTDDTFIIESLPEGQYLLGFQFGDGYGKYKPYTRTFYSLDDVPVPGDGGAVPLPVYRQRCFDEGTVITVADGASSQVTAFVGRTCSLGYLGHGPTILGSVVGPDGAPLEGISIQIIGSCSAAVFESTTPKAGSFECSIEPWTSDIRDPGFKVRLSDPAGHYRTIYYGATGDDFSAGTLVESGSPITIVMTPVQPDIEVAPLAVDFGNVQLPGSAPAVVTIQNVGDTDLVVSSLTLVPGSSSSIAIKSAPALPLTLAANASCEVTLEFKPPALGAATAKLAIGSSDPDEPTVQVALSGTGVASEAPPAEQVETTLEFIEDSVAEGTLLGTGPAGAANAHLQVLLNQIKAASDLAAAGDLTKACRQLENAMQRTDGDPQPPDFVTGPAAAELRLLIELTRVAIGCE